MEVSDYCVHSDSQINHWIVIVTVQTVWCQGVRVAIRICRIYCGIASESSKRRKVSLSDK